MKCVQGKHVSLVISVQETFYPGKYVSLYITLALIQGNTVLLLLLAAHTHHVGMFKIHAYGYMLLQNL